MTKDEEHTIFLSHSSLDKSILERLKGKLEAKDPANLFFFLSSDGRSIPFGANWAADIEDRLLKASILFAFISPNSIDSPWVYFEAGFAASRGIPVVPIALSGVKMGDVPFPIGLKQGFELYDSSSLKNIPRIINENIGDGAIEEEFTERDLNEIFAGFIPTSPQFQPAFDSIYYASFLFRLDSGSWNPARIKNMIQCELVGRGHDIHIRDDFLEGLGFEAVVERKEIKLKINGYALAPWIMSLCELLNKISSDVDGRIESNLKFLGNNGLKFDFQDETIKALLYGTGVEISFPGPGFIQYGNQNISIDPYPGDSDCVLLELRSLVTEKPIEASIEFLSILHKKGIISRRNDEWPDYLKHANPLN